MLAAQIQDVRHGIIFLGKVANGRRRIVLFRLRGGFRHHRTEDFVDIAGGGCAISAAVAYGRVTAPFHLVAVLWQLDAIVVVVVVVLVVLTRLRYDRAVTSQSQFCQVTKVHKRLVSSSIK